MFVPKTFLSTPESDKRFFDPHTGDGIILDDEEVLLPRVHEMGATVIDHIWCYSGVCSPFWRVYYNLDEGASVLVAGKLLPLKPDLVVVVPAGLRYDCLPGDAVRHLWIHFSVPSAGFSSSPASVVLDEVEVAVWRQLHMLASGKSEVRQLRNACAAALLNVLTRVEQAQQSPLSMQLQSLVRWLDISLAHPPSLDDMARRAGMGRRSFLRWFHSEAGATPVAYLKRRRILEACRLLRFGNDSVDQVAENTGFSNRNHFSRVFAKETGMGPAEFRRGQKVRES